MFINLILDVQKIPEYSAHLLNMDLKIEESIKSYFQLHFSSDSSAYEEFKEAFIDFTYNQYSGIEIIEDSDTFSFIEKSGISVYEKNKTAYLSFKFLPNKLDVFVKFILLPILDKLELENLIQDSH